jgi:hypothetical protein
MKEDLLIKFSNKLMEIRDLLPESMSVEDHDNLWAMLIDTAMIAATWGANLIEEGNSVGDVEAIHEAAMLSEKGN